MAGKLPGSAIQSNTITITQIQTTAVTTIVNQSGPRVSSLIYPGDDTAGNTVGGQTVYINGAGFETNNAIYINGNAVPSKSFISASNLSFTTPALSAGIYPVYVINTDSGATAIFVPGYISSAEPAWATAAGSLSESQDELSAWSYSLSATGDAPITYALAAGSSLPTGVSLAANGLISGTITSPSGNATTYTFSVVASDAQNQDSTRQFTVTTSTGEGVLFANNVLLIHADGTNNQNNHHFLDSSNNNFTITRANNATQGSFSPFSQTGWSAYFDGANDSLQIASSSSLDLPGDFTIECWVYLNVLEDNMRIFNRQIFTSSPNIDLVTKADGSLSLRFNSTADPLPANTSSGAGVMQTNKWHHVAIVRNGSSSNNVSLYVDGDLKTAFTNTANHNPSAAFYIGNYPGLDRTPNGYISNFRIVKGTAIYTSNFSPPTSPLTAVSNTSLLTCQSNLLVDEGPNNLTLTCNGDVSIQPFSPFVSGLLTSNSHSVYFDGNGDSLTYTGGSSLNFGTSDFTIELYVNMANTGTFSAFLRPDDTGTFPEFGYDWSTGELKFQARDGAIASVATSITPNVWRHIAVSRSGTGLRLFVDGTQVGTTVTNSTNFGSTSGTIRIGGSSFSATHSVNGSISNFRVIKGTALYTSNFTSPTTALTAVSNTSLLTCQSATLIDNSTNAFTITRNGDARPRKFNPFGQTFTANVAYSTANIGGSAYFDGTGDYLIVGASNLTASSTGKTPLAVGAGDFTIEGWFNASNVSSSAASIFKHYASPGTNDILEIRLVTNTVTVRYRVSGGVEASLTSGTITAEQWYHVAFVRNSGVVKGYLNGTEFGSANFTGNLVATTTTTTIGCDQLGTSNFIGEISNFRFVKGSAVYTSAFTPPTEPLTNIANTSLLCNFTNAGIFDQTAKNIVETVGDAKISTAQYKYGTGSIVFDGTGDYITIPNNNFFNFGSGNFTIECWVRPTAVSSSEQTLVALYGYTSNRRSWDMLMNAANLELRMDADGSAPVSTFISSTSPFTANTWHHVAFVRSGNTVLGFVNGTQVISNTFSSSLYNNIVDPVSIGAVGPNYTGFFTGHIDDLRITRGSARYTSNFTTPTSALKDK